MGAAICHPHKCEFCGREVDQLGHHGLSCRYSQGRLARHNAFNSLIHCSLAAAKIPSRLEPSGLHRSDGKRPDGVTMTPWSEGKFLVWDATCVDTFCESHKHKCASECGAAAAHAEGEKAGKYSSLDHAYSFQPIAIETSASVGSSTMSFLRALGHRLKTTTGEPQSTAFLMQRLSVAIQTVNAISVLGSLGPTS